MISNFFEKFSLYTVIVIRNKLDKLCSTLGLFTFYIEIFMQNRSHCLYMKNGWTQNFSAYQVFKFEKHKSIPSPLNYG